MIPSINRTLTAIILLFFFYRPIRSDVSISLPNKSQTFTVSGSTVSVQVSWLDSGTSPNIQNVESYSFLLCTGSNSGIVAVTKLAEQQTLASNTYTASIPASAGASGVYFIQIYAVYPGGHTIHYSNRFQLSGMTGTTQTSGSLLDAPPSAEVAVNTGTTTDITATMDVSASFSVTYTSQTGVYRFAPMQQQPGSTVTATTWTRQFPASAVTYFTSILSSPSFQSTITPGWSYSRTSHINDVVGIGTPTGAYKASEKIKTPYIKTNSGSNSKRFLHLDDDDDN